MNILKFIRSRSIIAIVLSVVFSFSFVAIAVNGATTISTNISTTGTLSVTGLTSMIQASSTRMSVFDTAYFGGSATSTFDSAGNLTLIGDTTLGDAVTDTVTLNGQLTSDLTSTSGTDFHYIKNSLSATSGEHNFLRVRAQSTAASGSTSDIRGVYAQAISNDSLFAGTITAIYANPIAKDGSETLTIRGILIDTETEGTPTDLNNMYGLYIRNKSSITVDDDNYSIVIDNEKMGGGEVQDAGIQLKTTTWGADVTAWTYGIDMNQTGAFGTADIRFQNGETIDNNTDGVIAVTAATTTFSGDIRYATSNFADATAVAGDGNDITLNFLPDLPALIAGLEVKFVAEAANSGAVTLAIDGGSAKPIVEFAHADQSALEANEIRSGAIVWVIYDGTSWQLFSNPGAAD